MSGDIVQVGSRFILPLPPWRLLTFSNPGGILGNPKSLLVLDSFRGHITDPVKRRFTEKNTDIAVIPGGCTSKLQPLDVSLNRPFKNNIRKLWADWMVNSAHELTKAGRLKRPSYVEVVNWVRNAWDNIPK